MYITDFYLALILVLTISLIFSEIFGVSPGGIITPAYLALVFDSPTTVVSIFLIAAITYFIVVLILPKFIILYGRRQFVAMIITALLIKLLLELVYPLLPFALLEFRGIGIVVPALIANCIKKQGIKITVVSVLSTTAIVFLVMNIIYYF